MFGFDKLSFESEPEGSSLRVEDTTGGGRLTSLIEEQAVSSARTSRIKPE